MVSAIRIKMLGNEIEVDLSESEITMSTIKSGFLLPPDAVVKLCYDSNGKTKLCKVNETDTKFLLPDGWQTMQFTAESDKAPSRPATPFDIAGPITRKRQRMDPELEPLPVDGDLISRIYPYALFYLKEENMKRSAIPVTKTLAITFRHGENKKLVNGDVIRLQSYQNQKTN
ncbi:hypothetical protein FO519_007419, partial [Halicephalobus sp. NKZ332]